MMALTHGAVSVALVALATPALPDTVALPLLVVAFLGGILPDLDIVADHRKTLHYPVGYSVLAFLLAVGYVVAPSGTLLLAAVLVGSAAVHTCSDVLAGSVEAEPWNPTTERAVYNHALGAWHRPRRYVRYSGAPEDWLLALVAAATAIRSPASGSTVEAALFWLVAVAGGYTLVRRRFSALSARFPSRLAAVLPAVTVEETESGATTVAIRFRS
ncbi:metal-dependent hydrolase [Halomicroarcula pellucida]|nr:metal-dependent hydrolase [Halomicroarcula pellucida]